MGVTYFKRFRMEIDLCGELPSVDPPLAPYRLTPWRRSLLAAHAEAKHRSFRQEIDATVFPCLGDYDGCLRLMTEIAGKGGFLPEATWLLECETAAGRHYEPCGTVQGLRDAAGFGAIQNLGIAAEHRGRGLGSLLLVRALTGFQAAGLRRAFLEVTAQNVDAVRLYERLGFRKVKTVYKASELACA